MAQQVLKVNTTAAAKLNYRQGSARQAWLAFIVAQNGKTMAQITAAATANPPSLQPKGKYGKAGKVEPPSGWVAFFTTSNSGPKIATWVNTK